MLISKSIRVEKEDYDYIMKVKRKKRTNFCNVFKELINLHKNENNL